MSSTSSPASAASRSDLNERECAPSRSAKSSPTAAPSSKSTGPKSPATRTCEPSPNNDWMQTEFRLTSSPADSRARISAQPALALELTERARAFGQSTPELLAKFDPDTSSWRTSQLCLDGALSEFSEAWPRSGLMLSGTAYQLPPLALRTDGTEFGLWPTPQGQYDGRSQEAWEAAKAKKKEKHQAGHYGKGTGAPGMMDLQRAVRMWPTPNARDYKGSPGQGSRDAGGHQSSLPASVKASEGSGSLNPTWVEWLMGFPLGWTALEPSETPSSRKSSRSSGGRS
jgi:hypothetical protein